MTPWFLIAAAIWFADAILLTAGFGFSILSVICVIVCLSAVYLHYRENA